MSVTLISNDPSSPCIANSRLISITLSLSKVFTMFEGLASVRLGGFMKRNVVELLTNCHVDKLLCCRIVDELLCCRTVDELLCCRTVDELLC